jgi:hypothetical protein
MMAEDGTKEIPRCVCKACNPLPAPEVVKEPGFFEGSAKTIAFDLGRRLVRWAIPNARIMLMPTEPDFGPVAELCKKLVEDKAAQAAKEEQTPGKGYV